MTTAFRIAAATLLILLSACSKSGGGHNGNAVHAADFLVRGNGAEIKSLDPHYIDGQWESNVVGDVLMGLTTDGPNGEPIAGAAESWETSPDGKTWTFHIRKHEWSDGEPVTAEDFVYAWRRVLEPARGAPYAYYLWLIKNGQKISEGKLPTSALGVTAKDDKTLVVELEHPAPYMLQYLLHQTVFPVPRHVLMKLGDAWSKPENYVGNGAYIPKEWIPNDHVTLVKNPRFFDAKNVRIETVIYKPSSDTLAALKEMRAGELDVQSLLPASEIKWLRAHMAKAMQVHTYLGVSYIATNFRRAPFQDVRMRQVFSLTYDRETITNKIWGLGEPPAYSFIPPAVANYPVRAEIGFKNLSYPQRIARARELMTAMGYGPDHHFHTTYDTTTSPDSKRSSAAFQQMLKQVWIDVDIVNTDTQVYYKKLQEGQFDIAGGAWIGDFNDPGTFLDLLLSGSGNNYGHYNNPKFDALIAQAQQTADVNARAAILRQAEQLALDDVAIAPTRFLVTRDLVQPYVKGWIPNIRDFNRSRWLSIDPTVKPERGD